MKTISPTPYPDVNEIVSLLLRRVQAILDSQLIGMYLHGSLANGGFDDHSDIDVVVVTASEVSEKVFSALQEMHEQITQIDSPWAIQIEISYIPKSALRHFDRTNNLHPNLERGRGEKLKMMQHESDWIVERHILRERGITVTGPDPKTLIDPVSPDDMRLAIINGVPIWVNPLLKDPSELSKRGFQSFFVLSLCRMMYTLKHGNVLSKYAAAEWGKENLDERWTPLIERALLGRQHPSLDAEPEDIHETSEMMRYVLGQVQPTPYPEVNEILGLLLFNAKEILGDGFVGMYLYGSLSSGDFDPKSSDIDFLVVTTDRVADKTISELEAMHNRIWATELKWASKLEGSYVPKELIRHHDPDGAPCPTVNEGAFFVDKRGSDWIIQRHIVREYGIVLAGPDPKTLIDPVIADDIRGSVLGILHEWWFPMLDDPSWLRDRGSEYHAFAVITMCRVLHALEHGTIVSKPTSIQWAREKLGKPWLALIEKAVVASRHEDPGNFLAETLDFIQFTKEQTENFEK